jgi:hypothetical protein
MHIPSTQVEKEMAVEGILTAWQTWYNADTRHTQLGLQEEVPTVSEGDVVFLTQLRKLDFKSLIPAFDMWKTHHRHLL